MAFCTLGPIWSPKACLATWGRSTPFSHAHRENQPTFQNKGFPLNQRWIMCRWSPQYRWAPPEHPRDSSHAFSAWCLRLPIRPVCASNLWHAHSKYECIHKRACMHAQAWRTCTNASICTNACVQTCLLTCLHARVHGSQKCAHAFAYAYLRASRLPPRRKGLARR